MSKSSKLFLAVVMASSLALAAIGVVHAQTANDTTTASSNTVQSATVAEQPIHNGRNGRHLERLEEQATLFNMSVEDLEKEIESGKPMYQIAAEHGVTYDTMKTRHLSDLKAKLDDMVKVGYMTQTQADEIYQQAQTQPVMAGLGFGPGNHGIK